MAKCPLKLYEKMLLENGILSQEDANAITKQVDEEIEEAVTFAKESPFPDEAELLKNIY